MSVPRPWDDAAARRLPYAQDSRRNLRRLSEQGALQFKIADTPDERGRFLDAMMRQKARRYVETRGTDSFDQPGYRFFFREATSELANSGCLHVSALLLDDKVLAAHWGYVVGQRFYYMMPSYEGGEWQRYSPGRLLQHHLIEWCARNGITIFDQGIGDEEYKRRYSDGIIPLYQLGMAITLKGHAYLVARKGKSTLARSRLAGPLKPIRRRLRSIFRS